MTVAAQQTVFTYIAGGGTVFAYGCRVLDDDDLIVTVAGVTKTKSVDYNISGVGLDGGGSVTFLFAPANGLTVRLFRQTRVVRETDYQVAGDFLAQTVNADFDRAIMIAQDILGASVDIVNAVRVPAGESIPALPDAATRANTLMSWDASGNPSSALPAAGTATALGLALLASSGSTLVNHLQAGSGAVPRLLQAKLRETTVTPEDFGAVGDGITDDLAAFVAAFNYLVSVGGGELRLSRGRTYKLSAKLSVPSRCGILGDRSSVIYAAAANFNNANLTNLYASNSAVLDLSGQTSGPFTASESPFLVGFRITSEVSQGRAVDAVVARNVRNICVEDVEISGFPVGVGVRASTLFGGRIERNFIHDFTDNAVWGSAPQITGIEIDDSRVNSLPSSGASISGNRIKDLTVGATVLAAWGYQTDGINIKHQLSTYLAISGNRIENVGEGVDVFGQRCTLNGNVIAQCYIYGLKFIHGASFNSVQGGSIHDVGLGGIVFAGSSTVGVGDTQRNTVSGVTVSSPNYNGAWTASSTYCVGAVDNTGTTGKPKNNLVTGCSLSMGTAGKYGWLDQSTGSANIGEGNDIVSGGATLKRVEVLSGGGSCRIAGSGTYSTSLV